jgi:hypothetical protein
MGATYVVLAPEHPLVERLVALGLPQEEAVREDLVRVRVRVRA